MIVCYTVPFCHFASFIGGNIGQSFDEFVNTELLCETTELGLNLLNMLFNWSYPLVVSPLAILQQQADRKHWNRQANLLSLLHHYFWVIFCAVPRNVVASTVHMAILIGNISYRIDVVGRTSGPVTGAISPFTSTSSASKTSSVTSIYLMHVWEDS